MNKFQYMEYETLFLILLFYDYQCNVKIMLYIYNHIYIYICCIYIRVFRFYFTCTCRYHEENLNQLENDWLMGYFLTFWWEYARYCQTKSGIQDYRPQYWPIQSKIWNAYRNQQKQFGDKHPLVSTGSSLVHAFWPSWAREGCEFWEGDKFLMAWELGSNSQDILHT